MDEIPTQSRGSLSSLLSKPPASRAKCAPHSSCRLHLHVYQVTAYLEMPFVEVTYHLNGPNTVPDLSLRHLWSIQYPTECIWKKKNEVTDGTQTVKNFLSCGFLCPPRSCLWHIFPSSLVPDFPKFSWVWKYFLHSLCSKWQYWVAYLP